MRSATLPRGGHKAHGIAEHLLMQSMRHPPIRRSNPPRRAYCPAHGVARHHKGRGDEAMSYWICFCNAEYDNDVDAESHIAHCYLYQRITYLEQQCEELQKEVISLKAAYEAVCKVLDSRVSYIEKTRGIG